MTEYNEPSFPGIFREAEFQDQKTILKKLLQVLSEWQFSLKSILDHGISFNDNLDIASISFTSSGTPDAENTVTHDLGKVPEGFIVYDIDKGATVYRGPTSWTKTNIYLRCNTATTAIKAWLF